MYTIKSYMLNLLLFQDPYDFKSLLVDHIYLNSSLDICS
jgi:hypothetical protein